MRWMNRWALTGATFGIGASWVNLSEASFLTTGQSWVLAGIVVVVGAVALVLALEAGRRAKGS